MKESRISGELRQESWISATFLLIFLTAISKVLGFFREVLIARNFGISSDVDAYFIAISVAGLVGGVFGSSLGIALIPAYHRVKNQNNNRGIDLMNTTLIFAIIVSFILMSVIYLNSFNIIRIIAPAISKTTMQTAVEMLNCLSLLVMGYSIFYVLSSVYNALHHFRIPAISDLFTNVLIIIFLLFLSERMGIYALITGFIIGLFVVVTILAVDLIRRKIIRLSFSFSSREFKELIYLAFPVFIFSLFPQINIIIENFFASSLQSGSIAALGYAKRVFDIIPTFISLNIAKAIFPTISSLASRGSMTEIRDTIIKLNKQIIVYFMPFTFVFIFFGEDIISMVLKRGKFDTDAVLLTTQAFVFYAPALMCNILLPIYFRLCYSFSDTKTPFITMCIATFLVIVANYLLTPLLGIVAIAINSSVSSFLQISILFAKMRKNLGGLNLKQFFKTLFFSIFSGGIAILPFMFLRSSSVLGFFISIVIYFTFYLFLSYFLLKEEILRTYLSLKRWLKIST